MVYDAVIIGGGIYGLYSALFCSRGGGKRTLLLECDKELLSRATYVNQARVHMGYHYPRSYSTALKTAKYFERFSKDFHSCINSEFEQVYATSSSFSWSNGEQFKRFCANTGIECSEISADKYFNEGLCDGAFVTKEYTFDAMELKKHLLTLIEQECGGNVTIKTGCTVKGISKRSSCFSIKVDGVGEIETGLLLNATYASVNQIIDMLGFTPYKIKYELCEIILCQAGKDLKNIGITVMDGPFFSIMPFGNTGLHSLTSVTFTPHITSYDSLPVFGCQKKSMGLCSSQLLYNCNICPAKPKSAWHYMNSLARKYLKEKYDFNYVKSLFSMKPILTETELSDARPTVITKFTESPCFISVLSGKINTVYDLDSVLTEEISKL